MRQQKNDIVKGLNAHMGIPVVPTDTAGRKPNYPYLSYKIITPQENTRHSLVDVPIPSTNPNFTEDVMVVRKEQQHFTLSVNAYSMDEDESRDKAIDAADWFRHVGYHYLAGKNIIPINVGNITDRTTQIVDDYERRYGFDVRIRAARSVAKRIEGVESYTLTGNATTN
ncbi:MAG: hypothetical protein FWC16_00775 [Defluviitaleaceae bacterium]|nr:hypothetical protein [Defluviitaleaceae bacterium]MCL2273438.1 hypothetical protein [Defluviitaleaceae bacterium]